MRLCPRMLIMPWMRSARDCANPEQVGSGIVGGAGLVTMMLQDMISPSGAAPQRSAAGFTAEPATAPATTESDGC